MSVERDGSLTRFVCDERGCHRNYEVCDESFEISWAETKKYGWVNSYQRGVWKHHCPQCARELGDD